MKQGWPQLPLKKTFRAPGFTPKNKSATCSHIGVEFDLLTWFLFMSDGKLQKRDASMLEYLGNIISPWTESS